MTIHIKSVLLVTMFSACSSAKPATLTIPTAPTAEIADLAAHRVQALQALRDYRERGIYPTDDGGMPLSVFRDTKGVRCPMAELIHASGRDDLVDAVATTANDVRLADVHTGPLYDWMLHSGLTLDEIAMVQGAMTVDEMRIMEQSQQVWVAAAKAEVRGRIAATETALRDGTSHALQVAAGKAQAPYVATGAIVPKKAIEQAKAQAQLQMQQVQGQVVRVMPNQAFGLVAPAITGP